jgi:GNAT superfamily N-acetyltransferase
VDIRRIPASSPDALALVGAMIDELLAIYTEQPGAPSATVDELSPPAGGYVAIYEDGRAVAGGGVKRLADGVGEIKRMYVVPEARSRGYARALLGALEDLARDLGYARVRLDTGWEQPHARALYASAGYSETDDYNANPYASYWGEKRL